MLILQSRHIFGNSTLLFVSGIDQPCFLAIKDRDIDIYFTLKLRSSIKCNKYNLLTRLKKNKTETEKNNIFAFWVTSTGPLTRFWRWGDKSFLNVVGIYLKKNHYEKVHEKMFLQKRLRSTSLTNPHLFSVSGSFQ